MRTFRHQVWDTTTQAFITTPKAFGKSLAVADLPTGLARFFYPSLSPSLPFEATDDPAATRPTPLPLDLLLPILNALIARLKQMERLLSTLEIRVRGSSLLIVIEGDPDTLREALDRVASVSTDGSPRKEEADEEEDSDAESVSTTDGEGSAKPHTRIPFDVKWIDFAHARAAKGEGADEGLILGVKTTRELLQGLVQRLKEEEK